MSKKYSSKVCERHEKMAKHAKGSILDIGFSQHPNTFLDGACGIDVVKASCPKNYKWVKKLDACKIHTIGTKFDTIIAGELIEHLENPSAFLISCKKSLNKGGRIVISTPNPCFPFYVLTEWIQSKRFFFDDDHLALFPPRIMEKLLEHNGFKMESCESSGMWNFLPFGMGCNIIYVCSKKD